MKNMYNKKSMSIFLAVMLLVIFAIGCSDGNDSDNDGQPWEFSDQRAKEFITFLVNGDFESAVAMFDRTMSRALSESDLGDLWNEIINRAGAYIEFVEAENYEVDAHYISEVTSRHEITGVTLRVVFDQAGLIAGFFILEFPIL